MANDFLSKRLKQARNACEMTQKAVYEKLNIKQSTFSAWEIGKSEPDIRTFLNMCRIYGIDDIQGYFSPSADNREKTLDSVELDKAIIKLRRLFENPDAFSAVTNCIDFEYNRDLDRRIVKFRSRLRPIKVFDIDSLADFSHMKSPNHYSLMELDAPDNADIGVLINGDGMEPMICKDEVVFLKYTPAVAVGEIGIFCVNDSIYLARLDYLRGKHCLSFINQNYPPVFFKDSDTITTYGQVLI